MAALTQYLYGLYGAKGSGAIIDDEIISCLSRSNSFYKYEENNIVESIPIKCINFQFYYVAWISNYINMGRISPRFDFISTKFQGCYMAAYTGEDAVRRGFHIHKGGGLDQRNNWNGISDCLNLNNQPRYTNGVIFKPNSYVNEKNLLTAISGIINLDTWGIISNNGACHSALVYERDGKWRLGRIESTLALPNMRIP